MGTCPIGRMNDWKPHGKCSKCGKNLYFSKEKQTGVCSIGGCSTTIIATGKFKLKSKSK